MDAYNKDLLDTIDGHISFVRKRILELAHKSGKNGSHTGGSLSLVEILCSLYSTIKSRSSNDEARDRVILSKGHGALALYCTLERFGILSPEQTATFESNGTHFFAHASRNVKNGIEFSGGSLSLGISYAVGVALSSKSKLLDNNIYVIVGDGECDEGLVWESAMSMANFHLDNVTVIVDKNGLQSDGYTSEVMDSGSLKDKFTAFGFNSIEVDGHSVEQLIAAFTKPNNDKPKAIIANTIKGKGISFMENQPNWHHGIVDDVIFTNALSELNKSLL